VGIRSSLKFSPLMFESTDAGLPDQFTPSVIQQSYVEADEIVNGGKGFGSLRIRMIGAKGPVLSNRIDCLLHVD
jgi:hypothetical protein